MRESLDFTINNIPEFKEKLLAWLGKQKPAIYLDNNSEFKYGKQTTDYHSFDCLAATGSIETLKVQTGQAFHQLKILHNKSKDWLFGHLSYDLKNELENLSSTKPDYLHFPEIHFFRPKFIFILKGNLFQILFLKKNNTHTLIRQIFDDINNLEINNNSVQRKNIYFSEKISKNEYLEKLNEILAHIQHGDIYEINFCQEFYSENTRINPVNLYRRLKQVSPTPFSSYYNFDNNFCLTASPERFIAKRGRKIISQPIKGTIRRGKTKSEDLKLIAQLKTDKKERAENIMIVDLVRNDLARTATFGSVRVEELCGIYSFPQVHQMISTISSELDKKYHFTDAIKNAFPMGSMTGAPKIRAMELIEKYESTKRGIYSGAIGYIDPNGDFDFNVVIRSLQYNKSRKYLSYIVGGAITSMSIPEKEYSECLLKAEAMLKAFK
ncbi:MAG: anthranilate synthase component I family protein [Bacteroidota bacterium]|nr:anthranilate synthase component I family protein [Bacteroidota bacterium]